MIPLPRPKKGEVVTTEWAERLVTALERALKITTGPGLTMQQSAIGTIISAAPQKAGAGGNGGGDWPEPDPAAPREILGSNQGMLDSSNWILDPANVFGVEVRVVTDIKFDTETGDLTYRMRTLKYDPYGRLVEITAEGDEVVITTAVECP